MERDMNAGLEALQADMAAHQRATGREVTARANQHLAAEAFQRLERQLDDRAAPAAPAAPTPIEAKRETREVDGRRYTFSTSPNDDVALRTATPAEAWFLEHALPRVELLLSKKDTGPLGQPSWEQRTLAVLALKQHSLALSASGKPEYRDQAELLDRRYMLELTELLEASNATFGDWKKDAPTKLVVSG